SCPRPSCGPARAAASATRPARRSGGRRCARAPVSWWQPCLLPSLPDLAADLLALVTHALALVRVGLAQLAYVRGDLAHLLLVDALDDEPGRGLDPEGDPLRRGHRHRVAEAERELEVLAPGLDSVADADDLQCLAVAVGHPGHHVGDQRPGQPVQRADLALVAGPGDGDDVALAADLDGRRYLEAQGALRALDRDIAAADGDIDTAGHGDGHPSDS